MQKFRQGVSEEYLKEMLFMEIVSNEMTYGYHCRSSDEQAHRCRQWIYAISDKRSECIRCHYHKNAWDKDRNFGQPFHNQITPEKHLIWE